MTIRYTDGRTQEAVLLSRTDTTIRVAAKGTDDVQVFTEINGTWVSEDCEPVRIEFEWQRQASLESIDEADCICSSELANRLLYLLFSGSENVQAEDEAAAPVEKPLTLTANQLIV
ncbi:MAG TPA: hypothetical protein VMU19_11970 [Bryobacteraceae bacterium]|nr:hypothetical protein [Bryobacteraceae bacterium]